MKTIFTLIVISSVFINTYWKKVEKIKIDDYSGEIIFYDFSKAAIDTDNGWIEKPDSVKVNKLKEAYFKYPLYLVKLTNKKKDAYKYFILRPNQDKIESAFHFDLDIIESNIVISTDSFIDRKNYQSKIIKTITAEGCRGGLIFEHMEMIQSLDNKESIIGKGIQLYKGLYTRVIPYSEIRNPLLKIIQENIK